MTGLNTALSALRVNQTALDVISNNIANANTPGFSRQVLRPVPTEPVELSGISLGTGVDIGQISQISNRAVEAALTSNISEVNQVEQALRIARTIENNIAPSSGSLQERFQEFFEEILLLQAVPDDSTQRQIVLDRATTLATEFQSVDTSLEAVELSNRQQIQEEVAQVNLQLAELRQLNDRIRLANGRGQNPNTLLDSHRQLVNELAESIDIQAIPEGNSFRYQFANDRVSIDSTTFQISVNFAVDGTATFTRPNGDLPLDFAGGRLAAFQNAQNELIPSFRQQIDQLANTLIRTVNEIQATGVGLNTGHSSLLTTIEVSDPNQPLSELGLPFDIQSGQFYVSVTDTDTGIRTRHEINVDADNDTLADIQTRLSNVPNLQSVFDPDSGSFSISATAGFQFEFSGQLPSGPERDNISGDAEIRFSGIVENLDENLDITFQIAGSGQTGVDDDLRLIATRANGQVTEFNLGAGYQVGSPIDLGNGVSIEIDSGTLNDGDQFAVTLVENPDTARFLSGISLNSFFNGDSAANIQVSEDLLANSDLLSAARTANSGDGRNLNRLLALRDQQVINDRSLEDQTLNITSNIALEVSNLTFLDSDLGELQNALIQERESVSGVDPNEEFVRLLQFQRAFQAAVRVITTIDETLNEVLNIVR